MYERCPLVLSKFPTGVRVQWWTGQVCICWFLLGLADRTQETNISEKTSTLTSTNLPRDPEQIGQIANIIRPLLHLIKRI